MDPSPGEGPRIAATWRGGVVLVSLYSWTCITIGVTVARLMIASLRKLGFSSDDAAALAASATYLGATVSWHYAVNRGLGKHLEDVYPRDAQRYFKAAYSAQLLQITAMALAKLSTVLLIDRVAAETQKKKVFLFGAVGFWFVYSSLVSAFQCGVPTPWEISSRKCAHGGPLVSAIVLGMVVDLVLTGWIFPILLPSKMPRENRMTVAVLFAARLVVPLTASGQAWAAAKAMQSDDPTWDGFELALFFQAVSSLSLIVANLPRIKRFLDVGGSGVLMNPRITENEIALSAQIGIDATTSGDQPLRLVPGDSTVFTTTVFSENTQRHKEKANIHHEWQKFVSMGSTQDEHTSTSSLCQHQGVMLHQEVTVQVEDRNLSV